MLESYLTSGRGIRFLLIDPDSAALQMAADRYYAERWGKCPQPSGTRVFGCSPSSRKQRAAI
jgi:hypothetical protein